MHCFSDGASDFAFTLCVWAPMLQCVALGKAPAGVRADTVPEGLPKAAPHAANPGVPSAAVPVPAVLALYCLLRSQ